MGAAFGHDFSAVRVHTDAGAARLADRLNARAFTYGQDIAFGSAEYRPGTLMGDALIAHELAHVVQQSGAGSTPAPALTDAASEDAFENDADTAAVGAVMSLWARARGGMLKIAQNAVPTLRSGLRLRRCDRGKLDANRLIGHAVGDALNGALRGPRCRGADLPRDVWMNVVKKKGGQAAIDKVVGDYGN